MGNESICFSISNKVLQEQLVLKEGNAQLEDLESILLKKDEQIALLERSILENSTMSALQRQNDELLQKVHAVSDCTRRGETEQVMLNDLVGRSDTQNSLDFSLPQSKCYREGLISENQISSSHQELELLKFEMSAKTLSRNSNAICLPSFLAEGKKEDIISVQRNIWAMQEGNSVINGTAKIVEGQVTREPDLSDNFSVETADIILESPLKSMSKEQLISHYIRVVAALRRDKEILLSEKTEEIYRLKRQCLRERGNGREIAALKRKLGDRTKKLEEVIKGNGQLVVSRRFSDEESEITSELEDELQDEKRSMLELITGEERESKELFDSIGLEQSSREGYLLVHIEELENEMEDIKAKNKNEIDVLRICLEETIKDRTMSLNLAIKESAELREQKRMLEDIIRDKDRTLSLALKENEDQKKQIILREKLLEEKENEYKNQQYLLQQSLKECQELKKENSLFEIVTLQKERALNLVRKEQEELKKQVVLLEGAVQENKYCTNATSRDLEEARKEKVMLEETIRDRERTLDRVMKEEEKRMELERVIAEKDNALIFAQKEIGKQTKETILLKECLEQKEVSLEWALMRIKEEEKQKEFFEAKVQKLEDCIKDLGMNQKQSKMQLTRYIRNAMDASLKFEETALKKLHHNFLRLKEVEQQLVMLSGQVNSFAVRESHYRKMYDRRYRNLQKAEEEVDLLGDEVDSVLSLLGKVYIVLNHYAPILQHYPGIPDVVNLIKKEIAGHVDMELKLCGA
jgi:hypothetical protein